MTAGSIAGGVPLALLSRAEPVAALHVVGIGLGSAMAATPYSPAFAVLTQVFRAGNRRAIVLLTRFGGFASTIFWPLATALIGRYGWRDAPLVLGALNLNPAVHPCSRAQLRCATGLAASTSLARAVSPQSVGGSRPGATPSLARHAPDEPSPAGTLASPRVVIRSADFVIASVGFVIPSAARDLGVASG